VIPAIKEILTKGSATASNLDTAMAALPKLEDGDKVYSKMLGEMAEMPTLQVAASDRAQRAEAERNFLDNTDAARAAVNRGNFDEMLQSANIGWMARQSMGTERFARAFGSSPEDASIDTIKPEIEGYRNAEVEYRNAGFEKSSEDAKRTADALQRIVTLLEQQRDKNEKRPVNRNGQAE
jgi:hypothetical protein